MTLLAIEEVPEVVVVDVAVDPLPTVVCDVVTVSDIDME
jgi:hypothetical protein